jgi:hypothetical protein
MIVDAGQRLRAMNSWRGQLEQAGWNKADVEAGLDYLSGSFGLAERGLLELVEQPDGRVTASPRWCRQRERVQMSEMQGETGPWH